MLATDPLTGETRPERVSDVIVTRDDHDYTDTTLRTAHGEATLTSTQHHPFWDSGRQRWTDAADLRPVDRLRQPDGHDATMLRTRNHHAATVTYSLTVEHLHTYYVLAGTTPLLVHNCGTGARDGAVLSPDELMARVRGLRDEYATEIAAGQRSGMPATVTAGYNVKTGQYAAGASNRGECAEVCVAQQLGGDQADIVFSSAIRPRTGMQAPVCRQCEDQFGRGAFQDPGTIFKSDE